MSLDIQKDLKGHEVLQKFALELDRTQDGHLTQDDFAAYGKVATQDYDQLEQALSHHDLKKARLRLLKIEGTRKVEMPRILGPAVDQVRRELGVRGESDLNQKDYVKIALNEYQQPQALTSLEKKFGIDLRTDRTFTSSKSKA